MLADSAQSNLKLSPRLTSLLPLWLPIQKKEAPATGASFEPRARPDGRGDVQRVIGL